MLNNSLSNQVTSLNCITSSPDRTALIYVFKDNRMLLYLTRSSCFAGYLCIYYFPIMPTIKFEIVRVSICLCSFDYGTFCKNN